MWLREQLGFPIAAFWGEWNTEPGNTKNPIYTPNVSFAHDSRVLEDADIRVIPVSYFTRKSPGRCTEQTKVDCNVCMNVPCHSIQTAASWIRVTAVSLEEGAPSHLTLAHILL